MTLVTVGARREPDCAPWESEEHGTVVGAKRLGRVVFARDRDGGGSVFFAMWGGGGAPLIPGALMRCVESPTDTTPPCLYDVAGTDTSYRLMCDVDVSRATNVTWRDDGAPTRLSARLLGAAHEFITSASANTLSLSWAMVTDASNERKLSLHLYLGVVKTGTSDDEEVPARSNFHAGAFTRHFDVWCRTHARYAPGAPDSLYVYDKAEWLEQVEAERLIAEAGSVSAALRWCLKCRFAADLAVYTPGRQMRTYLSDKRSAGRPLRNGVWYRRLDTGAWCVSDVTPNSIDTWLRRSMPTFVSGHDALTLNRLALLVASLPSQTSSATAWTCEEPMPSETAQSTSHPLAHLEACYSVPNAARLLKAHFRGIYWPDEFASLSAALDAHEAKLGPVGGRVFALHARVPGAQPAAVYFVVVPGQVFRAIRQNYPSKPSYAPLERLQFSQYNARDECLVPLDMSVTDETVFMASLLPETGETRKRRRSTVPP